MGSALPLLIVAGAAVYYVMQQQPKGPSATDLMLMQLLQGNGYRPPTNTAPTLPAGGGLSMPGGAIGGIIAAAGAGVTALALAIKNGMWRGGWEGITGNQLRDQFMAQFGHSLDQLGQVLMSQVLIEPRYHSWPEAEARRVALLTPLNKADQPEELDRAVEAIIQEFARAGITIQRGY